MSSTDHSQTPIRVDRIENGRRETFDDCIAVEEPMEIRLEYAVDGKRVAKSLSITMRTPGHDFELAAGFLYGEGVLQGTDDIQSIDFCGPVVGNRESSNIVKISVADHVTLDLERLQRNFYATSSCGICGKASLESLVVQGVKPPITNLNLTPSQIQALPATLRTQQPVFDTTGGLHASALVGVDGTIERVREDVGRHNAVDKLVGSRFLAGRIPVDDCILLLSGRASFELLQKAVVAGIAIVVAIGAPSSLAVEMAREFDITLIGFASESRFNIYSGEHRVG